MTKFKEIVKSVWKHIDWIRKIMLVLATLLLITIPFDILVSGDWYRVLRDLILCYLVYSYLYYKAKCHYLENGDE